MESALAAMTLGTAEAGSPVEPGYAANGVRITVVVPVLNAMRFLPETLASLLAAAKRTDGVELVFVDNGSTDRSDQYLASRAGNGMVFERLERDPDAPTRNLSAAARNFGAKRARGEFLSFIDADCIIAGNYFTEALEVLQSTGADATGCETEAPRQPHWIEATWHALHYVGRDREVHYLNSANFFISRRTFEEIGGFREDLPSGADAEIGQRLVSRGYRIYESPRVAAIHLGNPKTVRDFYRRNVWHALGMFGTVNRRRVDKPTAMMILHLLASIAGLAVLAVGNMSWAMRILAALMLQTLVPLVTVAYRARQTGDASRVFHGVVLYWLYYWARIQALALVLLGKSHRYGK
jgi:glycosyltransferase involved in cell wall biosynthesis